MAAEASSGELRDDDTTTWVRGLDYVQGWAEARDAAEELNSAFRELGLTREDVWATAHTDGGGGGLVRLKGTPAGIRLAAQVLKRNVA
ncbi:hypothetical protein [Streptomyces sp. NPDC005141]